jgi:hypothetical protein
MHFSFSLFFSLSFVFFSHISIHTHRDLKILLLRMRKRSERRKKRSKRGRKKQPEQKRNSPRAGILVWFVPVPDTEHLLPWCCPLSQPYPPQALQMLQEEVEAEDCSSICIRDPPQHFSHRKGQGPTGVQMGCASAPTPEMCLPHSFHWWLHVSFVLILGYSIHTNTPDSNLSFRVPGKLSSQALHKLEW